MTVSRFFSRPGMLRDATRERVREAVERTGYVPNQMARGLVQGRSHITALVVADITNPFFTTVARGMEDEAHRHGQLLLVGNTDEEIDRERAYLDKLIQQRVDGVVLAASFGTEHHLGLLAERGVPFVLVDRQVEAAEADTVRGDSYEGGRLVTRHLLDLGHRRVVLVGGRTGLSPIDDRVRGYRDEMDSAGLPATVVPGGNKWASGRDAVADLLASGSVPDALFAANNAVGHGALAALQDAGLRVPDDVAVACFDEARDGAALTAVVQPAHEIGRQAMRMLLERIDGYEGPPRDLVLGVDLVVRKTTAPRAHTPRTVA